MLQKTPKTVTGATVSIAHQNAAQWHYARAQEAWDVYLRYVDDRGLHHPNFIEPVRQALRDFRYHTLRGDTLLRRHGTDAASLHAPRSGKVDRSASITDVRERSRWADDFELALIQRGMAANEASIDALVAKEMEASE